jgi:hypothetical protein
MNIKTRMAIIAIAAKTLAGMTSVGIIITTAVAQNMTRVIDTSNMTTFEENITGAGNTTSSMANSTSWPK